MTNKKRSNTWERAVVEALKKENKALTVEEIVNIISENKLRRSLGANPAGSVKATLSNIINRENKDIKRAERGSYIFVGEINEASETLGRNSRNVQSDYDHEEGDDQDNGFINCAGIFWRRDFVDWRSKPRILGRQQNASAQVDFSTQSGVYVLYDIYRPIYVGQALSGRLGSRLKEHTKDRLSARWDRFSWFGLMPVDEHGKLTSISSITCSEAVMNKTLEAVLIETLEPALNRRRGDNLATIEYMQIQDNKEDSKIEMIKKMLNEPRQ